MGVLGGREYRQARVPRGCDFWGTWVPGDVVVRGNEGTRAMDFRGVQIPWGLGHWVRQVRRHWVGVCASVCPQPRRGPSRAVLGC